MLESLSMKGLKERWLSRDTQRYFNSPVERNGDEYGDAGSTGVRDYEERIARLEKELILAKRFEKELILAKRFENISRTLYRISETVHLSGTLEEVYSSIKYALCSVVDTSNFLIALKDKGESSCSNVFEEEVDSHRKLPGDVVLNNFLVELVLDGGVPKVFSRHGLLELSSKLFKYAGQNDFRCQNWLGVPLQNRDEVIGVMAVQCYSDPDRYNLDDLEVMVAAAIDHKRADQALGESEEHYRHLVENATDAIYLANSEGKILSVNRAACEALGYEQEEIEQFSLSDLDAKYTLEEILTVVNLQGVGSPIIVESEHVRADGQKIPVEVSLVSYQSSGKQYMLAAARDISERKRAEVELHASAERVKTFFSAIDDAIFVHPMLEEGFGNIIEVNDIACSRYGYSRTEYLSMTPQDITCADSARRNGARAVRKKLLEKRRIIFEATHIKKSGETFPVEINSSVVKQGENSLSYLWSETSQKGLKRDFKKRGLRCSSDRHRK